MYYIDDFEEYIASKGSSKATREAYISDIYELEDFLKARGMEFEDASPADISAYLDTQRAAGKSNATINRRIAAYKAFYKYIILRGGLSQSPMDGIKASKVAPRELVYLSEREIVELIELPDDSPSGKRDRALLELMYATGIRASEICELKLADIDFKIGFIAINSGSKSRMVPLGKPCRDALRVYISEARNTLLGKKKDCGALFLSYLGEAVTRQGVWKIIKGYAEKTAFAEKVSPQTIRNTFAAHLIQNGADLKSLQELLGHEDIMATKIYLTVTKNRIMDVYDKAFPRA